MSPEASPMQDWKTPLAVSLLIVICGLAAQGWYWPQLPERVATHFDAQGAANGWMSRGNATGLSVGLLVGLPIFFIGVSQLVRVLPAALVNIPNRQYWLRGEQRVATLNSIAAYLMWISVAYSAFIVTLNHLMFVANRAGRPLNLTIFYTALGILMGATFLIVIGLLRRFRRVPAGSDLR